VKLLPYDTFTIQTADPLAIVLERMTAQVERQKTIRWHFSRDHLPYEGTLSETGFQISRIIHYRNSFLPVIRGRFEPSPSGTTVQITMRLHPFVIGFLAFWYLTWYSFCFPLWLTGAMPTMFALQFIGLPIAVLFIFWGAFWAEAHRSRQDLEQMLLGHTAPNQTPSLLSRSLPHVMQWGIFLVGLTIAFLQITGTFRPSTQPESESWANVSCAEPATHSPVCTFSLVRTLSGHPAATALAISADGQTLVSGGTDKAIKVWDLKTGKLKKTFQSDSGSIHAVAIAPDGKTVVSGSADHMVRLWDLTRDQPPRMLAGHPEDVNWVGITPDSKTVISGSYGAIKQWDLVTGQLKTTFPKVPKTETNLGPITMIDDAAGRFNPLDINVVSNIALISDLKLVDLATNQTKPIATNQVENLFADQFLSAHISPDGKLAVLQFGNNLRKFETRLKVWDLVTGDVRAEGHATFAQSMFADVPLALSRDRIFGSADGKLKVWSLQTAQLEAVLETGWLSPLVVTPDGKLLAGLTGGLAVDQSQIKVWRR